MGEKKQYYTECVNFQPKFGIQWEMRSELAWGLVHHFGAIAGKIEGEDKAGRAKADLQTPVELVDRCFAIADSFVERMEQREGFRPEMESEEQMKKIGKLERIKNDAVYGRDEVDKTVSKQK